MRRIAGVLVCGICLAVECCVWAQDWTQWRGPTRDGVMRFTEPKTWPEKLNAKWKVPIGEGYASPLFAAGRILEFTRQGDDEVAMGINPENGKILWTQKYPAPYEPVQSAARHGKGPKSTPLYYDGKLYTFGISGILSAFDAANGKLAWRKEYGKDFKGTWPQFGTSMSPVAADGVVVVLVRSEEHTSELQSRFGISYAVFCLKKKKPTMRRAYKRRRVGSSPRAQHADVALRFRQKWRRKDESNARR